MNKAQLIAIIASLKGERADAVTGSEAILNQATTEKRSLFSEEELRKMEEFDKKADDLTKSIDIYERKLKKIIDSEANTGLVITETGGQSSEERGTDPVLSSEEYRSKFLGYMAGTVTIDEVRAMANSSTQGTVKAPATFEMKFRKYLKEFGIMRKYGTVIESATDKKYGFELGTGEAGWIDELGKYPESDDSFETADLEAYKVGRIVKISEEFLQDSAFDVEDYLAKSLAKSIAIKEDQAFTKGKIDVPTAKTPEGFLKRATKKIAMTSNAITADELKLLKQSVGAEYQSQSAYMMSSTTAGLVGLLKDVNGHYLWKDSITENEPDKLFGKNVLINDNMDDVAPGKMPIAFGIFAEYTIIDRKGLTIQKLVEKYSEEGQIGLKAFKRTDGALLDPKAITVLQMREA